MEKILVPTDFSEQAENALKVAAKLAKKYDCELHILHIIELPLHEIDPLNPISSSEGPETIFFMKLASKRFETLLKKDYLKGIKVFETIDFHQIHKGISIKCKELKIDVVVMGSNGSSGLDEMVVGSNTEKVVRTCKVPVLVIKKAHENFEVKDFVFASDFKNESKPTYEKAMNFAKLSGAKIHLLLVNTPNKFITTDEANTRIKKFTDAFDFKNFTVNIYNDTTVKKGIINFSNVVNADLIGMSTHGRQGISHFFNGSISEDLVNHAERPIVTFKI